MIKMMLLMMLVIMILLLENKREKTSNSFQQYRVSTDRHLILSHKTLLASSRANVHHTNWTTEVMDFRDRKDLLKSTPFWVNNVDLGL